MAADELVAAAARLEALASKATPGPWREGQEDGFQPSVYGTNDEWVAECGPEQGIDSPAGRGDHDARWIAILGPDIAPHLADLLRDSVDDEDVPHPAALALARLLNAHATSSTPTP